MSSEQCAPQSIVERNGKSTFLGKESTFLGKDKALQRYVTINLLSPDGSEIVEVKIHSY